MTIENKIFHISDAEEAIQNCLKNNFSITEKNEYLKPFLDNLREDLYVVVEYPYVDKLYRDSYYFYYSSKRGKYHRDTIRVAFFSEEVTEDDFRDRQKINKLQSKYLGFLIVRPIRKCIGRNVISPNALKKRDFFIRTTTVKSAINGIKLSVKGFPHSSQDGEAVSCAESTLWALMEYFGTRYSEYPTVLPSQIRELLKQNSKERLLPSSGLEVDDISSVIGKLGFGTRIYKAHEASSPDEFKSLLNCYIESGMPVILSVSNQSVAHSVLCIGRKYIPKEELKKIAPKKINGANVLDFDLAARDLILIDDNVPPYQSNSIESPLSYIEQDRWKNCIIDYFIVPLHRKIYLQASFAKVCLNAILDSDILSLPKDEDNYIRFFLTSGRSFKHNMIENSRLDRHIKDYIASIALPKFIWVCEISTLELIDKKLANGLVVLDATESEYMTYKPLIFAMYNNELLDNSIEDFWNSKKITLSLPSFFMYNDNLKLYQ